jgi:DNA mismatch repair ATPase MutS
MFRDRDFDPKQKPQLNEHEQALVQDLELNTLFSAMAQGDKFLFDTAKQVMLSSLSDLDTIHYRQQILTDCLENSAVVREIYSLPIESIENQKKRWMGIFSRYPAGILSSAIELLEMFVVLLKRLRRIADEYAAQFKSEGFTRFFAMIRQELDDDYLAVVDCHLQELRFRNGVLLSAELGRGNEGTNHILRRPNDRDPNWLKRVFERPPVYSFSLHPRDDHGARALGELKDRVINLVANAVGQSADHIDCFFDALRQELAFYIGCLNLSEQLSQLGEPISFPVPVASRERQHSFTGLYDACLALTMKRRVVGNDANAADKDLVIITGANQGGKSTFLRSIGSAQLMMQCGMFVPAKSFSANVCDGLYTHFKREEDATMESGKLDEELGRMSVVVDSLTSNSMLLFNESFAATNEREGSEIARQVTRALLDNRIKVFYVTHLYELARGFYDKNMTNAIFLRAERQPDGTRTFRLIEGEPLQTSYGQDLYTGIFGSDNGDRVSDLQVPEE